MKTESLKNHKTKPMTYDAMLEAGLFQGDRIYCAQHIKFREKWVIIGISKDFKKVCVAGWPPTIAQADDFDNWQVAKDITEGELKYREKEFGDEWL